MEIVKALGNPELARNSLLDKERGAFSKVNAAKVLAARREQEGWMERVEEHRSPLLPFEYIYISFCFVLLPTFRSSIVKWRADVGLECLLACVLLSSRNAIRSNKICFEAIIYKYCLVLFVFRRDDEANFFE